MNTIFESMKVIEKKYDVKCYLTGKCIKEYIKGHKYIPNVIKKESILLVETKGKEIIEEEIKKELPMSINVKCVCSLAEYEQRYTVSNLQLAFIDSTGYLFFRKDSLILLKKKELKPNKDILSDLDVFNSYLDLVKEEKAFPQRYIPFFTPNGLYNPCTKEVVKDCISFYNLLLDKVLYDRGIFIRLFSYSAPLAYFTEENIPMNNLSSFNTLISNLDYIDINEVIAWLGLDTKYEFILKNKYRIAEKKIITYFLGFSIYTNLLKFNYKKDKDKVIEKTLSFYNKMYDENTSKFMLEETCRLYDYFEKEAWGGYIGKFIGFYGDKEIKNKVLQFYKDNSDLSSDIIMLYYLILVS